MIQLTMFNSPLNMDDDRIKTPAEYDEETGRWYVYMKQDDVIYGLSSDTKPTNRQKGNKFFEMDTGEVFIWDGSQWRAI